jgi:hypothetical protein
MVTFLDGFDMIADVFFARMYFAQILRRFFAQILHRCHLDGVAGALFVTNGASGAAVVVELVAIAFSEFDHGIFRAGAVAAIAFETVAAGKAALCFVAGFFFGLSAEYFPEILHTDRLIGF